MVSILLLLAAPAPPAVTEPLPAGCLARLGAGKFTHPDRPTALAFSPDGATLYSGGTDGCARAWDVAAGKLLRTVRVPDATVAGLAVSADGTRVAVHFGGDGVRIFDARLKDVGTVPAPPVECLALNADGSLVAGVTHLGNTFVRNTVTGTDRVRLPDAKFVAFNPAGDRVLHAAADGTVTEFEVIGGRPTWTVNVGGEPTGLAVHPKSGRVLVATAETIRLYRPAANGPVRTFAGTGPVAFAGAFAVGRTANNRLALWDDAGTEVKGADGPTAVFAATATMAAIGGTGGRIRVGPFGEDVDVTALGRPPRFGAWTFHPGGKPADPALAFGPVIALHNAGPTLRITGASPGRTVAPGFAAGDYSAGPGWVQFPAANAIIKSVGPKVPTCLAAHGPVAAVGSADRAVWLYDAGRYARTFPVPGEPQAAAFLPGGTKLVVAGRDGFTRLWDVSAEPPKELWKTRVPRGLTVDVAASPDGSLVAVAAAVRVEVADAATGKRVFILERRWEDGPFTCVGFSPDGRLIAAGTTGSAGGVGVWEVATRGPAGRFVSHVGTTTKVAFFDRGTKLASAHADESVMVWDATGRYRTADPPTPEQAWTDLLKLDAAAGVRAVHALAAAPDAVRRIAVGAAAASSTRTVVADLIRRLDAPAYAERAGAQKLLFEVGLNARPAVEAAAETNPSAEVRSRASAILNQFDRHGERVPAHGLYGDDLRLTRAAWVLDVIGGPATVPVLETLRARGGRAGAEAAAVLARTKPK